MHRIFSWSRFAVLLAVVALLVAALAVFVFGLITTGVVVVESFGHGHFDAEGARALSAELIEMIDLFLLGTVLLITSIGLYQLFIDPDIPLPHWLSVANLEQLKFNLVAVIVVMLAVLFLGAAAGDWEVGGLGLLALGGGIALVILALTAAVYYFQKVHQEEIGHAIEAVHEKAKGPAEHTEEEHPEA